jgi:hypothetical protein
LSLPTLKCVHCLLPCLHLRHPPGLQLRSVIAYLLRSVLNGWMLRSLLHRVMPHWSYCRAKGNIPLHH